MRGILFKPDMIKAIVDGRKTQTRRVMQNQPYDMDKVYEKAFRKDFGARKPRYQEGKVVYIKETWRVLDVDTRTLRQPIHKVKVEYKLDCESRWAEIPATIAYTIPDNWRSPLFMPAWAARYFIQITDVRVERLQSITIEDCLAEGLSSRSQYARLWDSINPPYHSWSDNPWCWVYSFKEVSHDNQSGEK